MCSLKEPAQKLQIERTVMQAAEQRRDERALCVHESERWRVVAQKAMRWGGIVSISIGAG